MSRTQNPRSLENLRQWPKGESGNPGGRPRGFVTEIRRQTKNGFELVSFALRVLRNEEAEMRDRAWACTYLTDRGFGKPTQSLELDGPAMVPAFVVDDAATLFDDRMHRLQAAAGDGHLGPSEGTVPENPRMTSGDPPRPVDYPATAQDQGSLHERLDRLMRGDSP
jgi:Family of unknown function (DUF5681)